MATMEMAKLLVERDERLSVTMLVMKPLFGSKSATPAVSQSYPFQDSNSRIRFINLPEVDPLSVFTSPPVSFVSPMNQFVDAHKDHVRKAVAELGGESGSKGRLAGFVIDMFCTSMIDLANEFAVPSYLFLTTNAATLGLMLHFQSLRDDKNEDLEAYECPGVEVAIPTCKSPVPVKLLPAVMFHKDDGPVFLNHAKRFREMKGIVINTFFELESYAMKSLSGNEDTPPIYSAGPILHVNDAKSQDPEYVKIMRWLDEQPASSVVFLCFGSNGYFNKVQVKEIASALERCGHRFLWSLRAPPVEDTVRDPGEYENFEEVLPEGFLKRTSGYGKMIGWAPQVAVLRHSAVGGFVSHCGWNSVLESIWYGVPIAAWPLFAEQQVNAFELVKHLGLGVEIKMDYQVGCDMVVTCDQIENGIKKLMDPYSDLRVNIQEMKVKSRLAVQKGGSSFNSMADLIKDVINDVPS